MPSEAKPLFRPEALRPKLTGFTLLPHVETLRPKLSNWAELLHSGEVDSLKEREILPSFLNDIFLGLLGYTGPADGSPNYTLSWEQHVQVGGRFADGVLGRFGPGTRHFLVALEGKGPQDPLDRPYGGRAVSAVEQAYNYAINLPCDWIIVTNIRQIRLYHKGHDQQTYERFDTETLSSQEGALKKFVFVLGADRIAPSTGMCHLDDLLGESQRIGKELTHEYYVEYARMRRQAFERLCEVNPGVAQGRILTATQKLLDRVLFCAFCEDRGLLPSDAINAAYQHTNPYNPQPIWENFRGLFRSIDQGNPQLQIPRYNGGLFEADPLLDQLIVPHSVCEGFAKLATYDYRPPGQAVSFAAVSQNEKLIDVDILGHIFEQSISDLERLRNRLDGHQDDVPETRTRRRKEGVFYTPAFITRYIVSQALGRVLAERFGALRTRHEYRVSPSVRPLLVDPNVYEPAALKKSQKTALQSFWENWQEELKAIRIVDPACGSGAFLIEAFDQMHAAYQASNDRLEELRGTRTFFDLDKEILQNNLYGVDLNDEAVQICKLSLWIKTAQYGKVLTSLDNTIRVGNSVVDDPTVHPKAFAWQTAFPEVFAAGGFDVVVANPPYVRQEWISDIKPYLQEHYQAYDGVADLYVYFYELGLRLLKPGGRLSYVVTNKWMKAGYGEPLRKFFAENAWMESVVDFGHAKQVFEDADVFPSIVVARKPDSNPPPLTTRVCAIPREQLRIDDLAEQIKAEGFEVPRERLTGDPWTLEPIGLTDLMIKLKTVGAPLAVYVNAKPLFGIKTGLNEAFLIKTEIRNALIASDRKCGEIIKPYVRGQDIKRWHPIWQDLWIILLKSSSNIVWPWSKLDFQEAEESFHHSYPSLYQHFKRHEERLRSRSDKGVFWWELRSCAYYQFFDPPKIMWQDLGYHSKFCLCPAGLVGEATCFSLPSSDSWLLATLNSPVLWSWLWRNTIHGKDEVLRLKTLYTEKIPVPRPTDEMRLNADLTVGRLIDITKSQQTSQRDMLDLLRVEYDIDKPSKKLSDPFNLDTDPFVTEVKKVRGRGKPLTVAALKALREEHGRSVEPARTLAIEALTLERKISDLVNAAFGLTPEEVALMWKTAPPRMPLEQPPIMPTGKTGHAMTLQGESPP